MTPDPPQPSSLSAQLAAFGQQIDAAIAQKDQAYRNLGAMLYNIMVAENISTIRVPKSAPAGFKVEATECGDEMVFTITKPEPQTVVLQ